MFQTSGLERELSMSENDAAVPIARRHRPVFASDEIGGEMRGDRKAVRDTARATLPVHVGGCT